MSATIINLIIQLIAGAVGGNAAGAASKDISLGTLGNTIAGAVGGVGGGQLLSALIPMMAGAGNNVDIGALASQAVGGGVAGAIVAGVVGLIKNKMASLQLEMLTSSVFLETSIPNIPSITVLSFHLVSAARAPLRATLYAGSTLLRVPGYRPV